MFNVFDSGMRYQGELEGVTSAQWSDSWNSVGAISITAALTQHNDALLKVGSIVEVGYLANAPDAENEMPPYILCNIQRNAQNGTILADGKTADYILHRRNASLPKFEGVTIAAAAQSVVADNLRGLPVDVGSFPGDAREDAMPDITLESGALDDLALQILAFGGYGRQLRRQGNRLRWAVDPGRDKRHTPEIPVFADENGSASGSVLGDDDSLTCNVATSVLHYNDRVPELAPDAAHQEDYIDARTERYAIGDTEAEGLARRELWCGDFFQETDESEEDFRSRAQAAMEQSMQEHVRVLNLSAAIDPRDYGTLYRTGDLLRARAGGISLERRVTAANWVYDANGTKCTLRLGPPTNNVLRQFKERKPLSSAVSGGIAGARAAAGNANKKIIDLHRKWLAMIIAIGDVSAGLDAAIQNFEEYREASAEVFAQVGENAAGIAAIASDDVLEQLRQARTTMYAAVQDGIDGCVQQAYLELYAVSDGSGNSKTFAELVADAISLKSETGQLRAALNLTTIKTDDLEQAQATLETRVGNAETALGQKASTSTVTDLAGRVTTNESAISSLTTRAGAAEAALLQKADSTTVTGLNGRVTKNEEALTDITTRVGNAETSLSQKASAKSVTDLSGRVSTVETAQTNLETRVGDAETSLSQKASSKSVTDLEGRVSTVETAQTSLTTRISNVETGLSSKVSNDTFTAELSGKLGVQAATEIYAAKGDINAYIGAYVMADGQSLADIKADLITLTGKVNVVNSLSVADGLIRSERGIITPAGVRAYSLNVSGSGQISNFNADILNVQKVQYTPTTITSIEYGPINVLGHT